MKQWLRSTFSDRWGTPSFKRQSSAILILASIVGTFLDKDVVAIAGLVSVVLMATAFEKYKKE